jgi:hypothetical protein
MRDTPTVRAGGIALIVGAIAFMAVFAFLAARFDYPAVLDGRAADVLPRLLATGPGGRAVWALYGFLPLVWIPAGVGAFHALRPVREGSMRGALLLAVVAALAMMLGLLRWPSIHWALARAYAGADPAGRAAIATLFTGLNSYLGNYLGEFLGELAVSLFFLLSALAMLARGGRPSPLDGVSRGGHRRARAGRDVPQRHRPGGAGGRSQQLPAAAVDDRLRHRPAPAGRARARRGPALVAGPRLACRWP